MKKIYPFTYYLLYFGANACLYPYWILYYQSLGFKGAQIGLLTAIGPLIFLVGAPFWTGIADKTQRHKLLMGGTFLVAICLVLVFPFLKTFFPVLVMAMLFSFIFSPVNSFADTATMTMLGDQKEMYGRVRMGGTIGWGVIVSIGGIVIEKLGLAWAFWLYAALMFAAFLVSRKFTFHRVKQEVSIKHGVRKLFSNRRLVLFLATAFVCGMALTSINSFLSAYMAELGYGASLVGVAFAIGTVSELPSFFFSNLLLARLKPHGMLVFAMVATTVRLFLYATVTTEAGILVFQLINGMTFGFLWVAGVSYVNRIAPPDLKATAQGIFSATVFGFGSATAGFVSAILLERVGGAQMYTIFGVLTLTALVVYLLLERRLPEVENEI